MTPRQPKDALAFIADKVPRGAPWNSDFWAAMEPEVRVKAMFSARVENARFLERAKRLLVDFQTHATEEIELPDGTTTTKIKTGGRADFVRQMREFMAKEGMFTEEQIEDIKMRGDTDITALPSRSRLNLIFDTNVRSAWGFGRWKSGMEPVVLRRFPAAKFVRIPGAQEKRPIHAANENQVRLKWDDQFWAQEMNAREIGGFEVPWPPYGFNSHMDQQDVSREEAERLKLLRPGEAIPMPEDKGESLTDTTQASVEGLSPEIKGKLIADLREEIANMNAIPDARELARQGARKARREAMERTLRDAREREEAAEVARIERLLQEEYDRQQYVFRLIEDESTIAVQKLNQSRIIQTFATGDMPREEAIKLLESLGLNEEKANELLDKAGLNPGE